MFGMVNKRLVEGFRAANEELARDNKGLQQDLAEKNAEIDGLIEANKAASADYVKLSGRYDHDITALQQKLAKASDTIKRLVDIINKK
jgi:uncharacterized protein YoxC